MIMIKIIKQVYYEMIWRFLVMLLYYSVHQIRWKPTKKNRGNCCRKHTVREL